MKVRDGQNSVSLVFGDGWTERAQYGNGDGDGVGNGLDDGNGYRVMPEDIDYESRYEEEELRDSIPATYYVSATGLKWAMLNAELGMQYAKPT